MDNEKNPIDSTATNGETQQDVAMPARTEKLEGPGRLDLNPLPRVGRHLSKKIGLMVGCFLFLIVALILYGVMSRGQKKTEDRARTEDTNITAATLNAKDAEDAAMSMRNKQLQAAGGNMESSEPAISPVTTPGSIVRSDVFSTGNTLVPPLGVREFGQRSPRLPTDTGVFGGRSRESSLTPRDAVTASTFHVTAADEKLRENLYKLEQDALFAPTTASTGSARSGGVAGLATGKSDPLASLISQVRPLLSSSAGLPSTQSKEDDPNMQDRKVNFIEQSRNHPDATYLAATRTMPLAQYEIKAGWDIPATLEQVVNTDLPGEIRVLVRENVYDTKTGRILLIPQGSRVLGKYDSHVAYGQSRVQVIWTRLIYPDGSSIDLGAMLGQDATGGAGFHDKVNNHYARMFSMALLTSAFSAGIQLSQSSGSTSTTATPTASQTATQALGQQMGELGIEIARKNMNIQPTITVPIGYRFNVRVSRDIVFDKPYSER
jgi:type IV secretion system protein VirB10